MKLFVGVSEPDNLEQDREGGSLFLGKVCKSSNGAGKSPRLDSKFFEQGAVREEEEPNVRVQGRGKPFHAGNSVRKEGGCDREGRDNEKLRQTGGLSYDPDQYPDREEGSITIPLNF